MFLRFESKSTREVNMAKINDIGLTPMREGK
jgi:hypothetical protein